MSPSGPIDRARVLHVAKLARVSLSDAEADAMTRELSRIVEYVAQLDELDTRDVPPTTHLTETTPLRADEVRAGLSHDEAMANAPLCEGGGFAVPRFLDSPTRGDHPRGGGAR
jgi:aspartyl-tRNA(Asn)/glutamyl-tRNA(Gln) amidotransferase subunit C